MEFKKIELLESDKENIGIYEIIKGETTSFYLIDDGILLERGDYQILIDPDMFKNHTIYYKCEEIGVFTLSLNEESGNERIYNIVDIGGNGKNRKHSLEEFSRLSGMLPKNAKIWIETIRQGLTPFDIKKLENHMKYLNNIESFMKQVEAAETNLEHKNQYEIIPLKMGSKHYTDVIMNLKVFEPLNSLSDSNILALRCYEFPKNYYLVGENAIATEEFEAIYDDEGNYIGKILQCFIIVNGTTVFQNHGGFFELRDEDMPFELVEELIELKRLSAIYVDLNETKTMQKYDKESYYKNEYETFSRDEFNQATKILMCNSPYTEFDKQLERGYYEISDARISGLLSDISAMFDDPIHNCDYGEPGDGKSEKNDNRQRHIPGHRKMIYSKGSTDAALMRMSKSLEGSDVLRRKVIFCGDWGTKAEQERSPDVQTIFKPLMSGQQITKHLVNKDTMENETFSINGCGPISCEVVEMVEAQFGSRVWISTVPVSVRTFTKINRKLNQEAQTFKTRFLYKQDMPLFKCAYEVLWKAYELIMESGSNFQIINPFNDFIMDELKVMDYSNQHRNMKLLRGLPKSMTYLNLFKRDWYYSEKYNTYILFVSIDDFRDTFNAVKESIINQITNRTNYIRYLEIIEQTLTRHHDIKDISSLNICSYEDLKGDTFTSTTHGYDSKPKSAAFVTIPMIKKNNPQIQDSNIRKAFNQMVDEELLYYHQTHGETRPNEYYVTSRAVSALRGELDIKNFDLDFGSAELIGEAVKQDSIRDLGAEKVECPVSDNYFWFNEFQLKQTRNFRKIERILGGDYGY